MDWAQHYSNRCGAGACACVRDLRYLCRELGFITGLGGSRLHRSLTYRMASVEFVVTLGKPDALLRTPYSAMTSRSVPSSGDGYIGRMATVAS